MSGTGNIGESSDNPVGINVTALVDVIFCLCLFFMCAFHFKEAEGKIESWLPKGGGPEDFDAKPFLLQEIRITLTWSPEAAVTIRTVGRHPPAADDAELMQVVRRLRDELQIAGKTDWPVVIEAKADVPWQEVVHVMDLCRNAEFQRIELAAPEAPIE